MTFKRILGREKLKRKLKRIPDKVRRAGYAAYLKEARKLVKLQKKLVRKDTGDLADGIGLKPDPATDSVKIVAAGKDEFYGVFEEFGTENSPGQPFFFPPYRASRRGIKRAYRRAVRDAARAVAKS